MSATIFTIKRSEIEGRLDPLFYKAVLRIEKEIISHSKYDVFKVRDVCSITRGRFGHRPRNDPAYYGGKYPFIQTGDIVKASDFDTEIEFSQTLNELGLSTSRLFKSPKLLFTIAANIGDTAILTYDSCFPDSIVALDVNENITNIDYLNIYFKILKPYIYDLAPFSAQRNLNNKQLEEIPLIIPPILVQQKIIYIYRTVQIERREKYKQAKQLLDSIDSYLLDELGIKLPQKDNSLSKRIFTTKFSEVSGERWDPKFYSTEAKSIKNAVENSKYNTKVLEEFIVQSVAGDWGYEEDDNIPNTTKCLVIRSTEFDNDYNLKLDNTRAKYRLIPNLKLKKIDLRENDLLIEKSGGSEDQPVGRIAILTKDILESATLCFSNFIHKIRVHDIDAEYLFCFLKTAHNIKLTETMFAQTNGLQNLIMQTYFNQKIPLPPLPKQKEIASHIREIREQAKQLQVEVEQTMQEAKKQIEKMILGE